MKISAQFKAHSFVVALLGSLSLPENVGAVQIQLNAGHESQNLVQVAHSGNEPCYTSFFIDECSCQDSGCPYNFLTCASETCGTETCTGAPYTFLKLDKNDIQGDQFDACAVTDLSLNTCCTLVESPNDLVALPFEFALDACDCHSHDMPCCKPDNYYDGFCNI
jgi:hypothetical protein